MKNTLLITGAIDMSKFAVPFVELRDTDVRLQQYLYSLEYAIKHYSTEEDIIFCENTNCDYDYSELYELARQHGKVPETLTFQGYYKKTKRFFTPEIVVRMDGGISSQMHQYLLGRLFAERGIQVSYDLKWFKTHGKDMHGKFERKFELLQAFPHLEFHEVNALKAFFYRKFRRLHSNYFDHETEDNFLLDLMPPKYLGDYYHSPHVVWTELFTRYFYVDSRILGEKRTLFNEINDNPQSVAIHVRMGDLKEFTPAYGAPASAAYFQKAIDYFSQKLSQPMFYIFSDEPKLVENELLKNLEIPHQSYKIVSCENAKNGYEDLFLISACAHQITSKGSLGKFGAMLHDEPSKTVVLCDFPTEYVWKNRLKNTVFL